MVTFCTPRINSAKAHWFSSGVPDGPQGTLAAPRVPSGAMRSCGRSSVLMGSLGHA